MKASYQPILDFDDEFHDQFQIIGDKYFPELGDSEFPISFYTLLGLMATANSIKLAMYDLAEESDTHLYVVKLLHRSFIEHYLKFYYILFRLLNEKSDSVGIEYKKFSSIDETMAFINASNVSAKIVGKSTEETIHKQLKKKYPDLELSKKEIQNISSKWKHRHIIKYLKNNSSLIEDDKSIFLSLISQYAELSSFVHGGTFAEQYYHKLLSQNKLQAAVDEQLYEVAIMAAIMKCHLLIAVAKVDETAIEGMVELGIMATKFIDTSHNKYKQQDSANAEPLL